MTLRRTTLTLGLAAAALGAADTVANAAGFSMSPSIAQTTAAAGASTAVTASNSTGRALPRAPRRPRAAP